MTYKYIAFNKPYGVLSQFTSESHIRNLSEFNLPKGVYAVGRLDKDSEGLLLLSNDGAFNQKVTNPKAMKSKKYHVQIEGIPSPQDIEKLKNGVIIKDYLTAPCKAKILTNFSIPPRVPPIRERKNIPTTWLEIEIKEGKNRQVRRMTAAIGFPTLRLIRVQIGNLKLGSIPKGKWLEISKDQVI